MAEFTPWLPISHHSVHVLLSENWASWGVGSSDRWKAATLGSFMRGAKQFRLRSHNPGSGQPCKGLRWRTVAAGYMAQTAADCRARPRAPIGVGSGARSTSTSNGRLGNSSARSARRLSRRTPSREFEQTAAARRQGISACSWHPRCALSVSTVVVAPLFLPPLFQLFL